MVRREGSRQILAIQKWNFRSSHVFSRLKAERKCSLPGWRRTHVHWYDHSYYSRHRPARRIQRHRRRSVLRHRLLRRWRPWPGRRHSADPAIARQTVSFATFTFVMAGLVPAIHVLLAETLLRNRRVGKGALAPCPPSTAKWWARFA